MLKCVFVAAILFSSAVAMAQTWPGAEIQPAAATENDDVRVTFTTYGLCHIDNFSTVTEGTTIRTTAHYANCLAGPPSFLIDSSIRLGRFPPNTYTYEIYFAFFNEPTPSLRSRQALVIAPFVPAAPTLNTAVQIVVALLFAAVGVIMANR